MILSRGEAVGPTLPRTLTIRAPDLHSQGAPVGQIHDNILQCVGRTPTVRLNHVTRGLHAEVLGKCEFLNPGGSVKDRIGVYMLEEAERRGEIKPGDTLIEATSGNTGIGIAMAAAMRGYRMILVMPENQSIERRQTMRVFGAELVLTPKAGGMEMARDVAEQLRDEGKGR